MVFIRVHLWLNLLWFHILNSEFRQMEERRKVIKAAVGAGLAAMLPEVARAQADPRNARPQDGDRLVFAEGERKGALIKLDALPVGGPPVTAMPQDAASGTVRDGSRLNQILLVRLDPARLTGDTQARAAQGVVAYSAVCTHAGCDSFAWTPEKQMFKCPCHDSEFDPADAAKITGGPATRRLAALPLKIVDGVVAVA
ncbi:MAG TPA: Rieske (2Fe-2S) protein, partial [Burkholderiales bacterium]|nr:Rieske (2Fe-2S) protein [Burkholderiales bacterium]